MLNRGWCVCIKPTMSSIPRLPGAHWNTYGNDVAPAECVVAICWAFPQRSRFPSVRQTRAASQRQRCQSREQGGCWWIHDCLFFFFFCPSCIFLLSSLIQDGKVEEKWNKENREQISTDLLNVSQISLCGSSLASIMFWDPSRTYQVLTLVWVRRC